ncbi:MAG: hypothetical protein ACT4PW_11720 [Acidimicrobiia bacterium]
MGAGVFALALLVPACGDDADRGPVAASTISGGPEVTTELVPPPATAASSTTSDGPATDGSGPTTPDTDAGPPLASNPDGCSAAALGRRPAAQPELPGALRAIRIQIVEAAVACDFDRLEALAAHGGTEFTFSFGAGTDPSDHWRQAEADGEEPMRYLATLLSLPYGTVAEADPALYAWPSAFTYPSWDSVPEAERQALLALYSEADLAQFDQFGSYGGFRVGITEQGDWLYFVAGV